MVKCLEVFSESHSMKTRSCRDGKKGKGAQGEGAIKGVYTDYKVGGTTTPEYEEWFYLATYDDVAKAEWKGDFSSGVTTTWIW